MYKRQPRNHKKPNSQNAAPGGKNNLQPHIAGWRRKEFFIYQLDGGTAYISHTFWLVEEIASAPASSAFITSSLSAMRPPAIMGMEIVL